MGRYRSKKKTPIQKLKTKLKNPSIVLDALIEISKIYLKDLDFPQVSWLPANAGNTIRFQRYKRIETEKENENR